MDNLKTRISKEITRDYKKSLVKTQKDINNKAFMLTSHKKKASLQVQRDFINKKLERDYLKDLEKTLSNIDRIGKATRKIKSMTISTEWQRSRMWGANPITELKVAFKDGGFDYYTADRIGGCGYCKASTATSVVFNQCDELLNMLYTRKNKKSNLSKKNHDLFGYGAGYGFLPYFEGGVGLSSHWRIFKKLGAKSRCVADGKSYDVYEVNFNQGLEHLKKLFIKKDGSLRDTKLVFSMGDYDIDVLQRVLKDFKKFEFTGFDVETVCYGMAQHHYVIFKAIANSGAWFEYKVKGNNWFEFIEGGDS